MKKILFIICFISCSIFLKSQTVEYSGQIFNATLYEPNLDSSIDSLIIDNCTFNNITGTGLIFGNIAYVEIINSTFQNLSNGAISGKGCEYILIKGNTIDLITHEAIYLATSHSANRNGTIVISDNNISNIKRSDISLRNGSGMYLSNADSISILNNTIQYCESGGISAGRYNDFSNPLDYLLIDNNNISYTLSDGISTQENISEGIATNNIISNIAYDGIGELPVNGDHGIYWQAPDGLLKGNEIFNNFDGMNCTGGCKGSGISLRTSARVLENKIYNCSASGINYYNDHPAGAEPLIIANNVVYDNQFNGIYVSGTSSKSTPNSVQILNNTVVNKSTHSSDLWHQGCPIAIRNMSGSQAINGNIMIYENHTDSAQAFWSHDNTSIEEYQHNYPYTDDIGFVDFINRDLKLSSSASDAIEKIPEMDAYVSHDFLGNQRIGDHDIGAFEFSQSTSSSVPTINADFNFELFPNPVSKFLFIKGDISKLEKIIIYKLNGRIFKSFNVDSKPTTMLKLDLESTPAGAYIIYAYGKNDRIQSAIFIKGKSY